MRALTPQPLTTTTSRTLLHQEGALHWRQRRHAGRPRQHPAQAASSEEIKQQRPSLSRRGALQTLGLTAAAALLLGRAPLAAAAAAPEEATGVPSSSQASSDDALVTFTNPSQGYSLQRPASWEQLGKAGADSLFRDPQQKSTSVGVTVYPVTIGRLEEFGSIESVGEKLLGAERSKESTLGVAMLTQQSRTAAGGAGPTTYDFEYELESTRGRKRVLSTVTIAAGKLYIANGTTSCSKESCAAANGAIALLEGVVHSLRVVGS